MNEGDTTPDIERCHNEIAEGEVWIDPDTGLGWTITEVDGEFVSLVATMTEERMEHASRLQRLYRHDPADHA